MKRALAAMLLVPALARAGEKGDSFFLAADPHVPLAIVHEGTIKSAVESRGHGCGKRSRWAKVGSTWRALDAWGQIAGSATVQFVDESDATGCAEVVFAPKFHKNSGRFVFVSADSAYVPPKSARWSPTASAHEGFEGLLDATLEREPQNRQSERCTVIPERSRYFQMGKKKLAVGGGEGGYVIAGWGGKSWTLESKQLTPASAKSTPACYRPVSVFDLDGDGAPEIVMRYFEADVWGDVVLAKNERGQWTVIADSPGGAS